MNAYIERVLEATKKKNASEPEFLQTVEEVFSSLEPVINAHPEYEKASLLERIVEPDLLLKPGNLSGFYIRRIGDYQIKFLPSQSAVKGFKHIAFLHFH